MAISKKQSSVWVKVVLVVVIVAFVGTLVPAAFLGGQGDTGGGATSTGATLERIAQTHLPTVRSNTAVLASDPTSYTALVNLGNAYYDWGLQLQQEFGAVSGHDLPMWISAANAYEQAIAVRPGDPSVATDMAVALFYAGQTARSVEVIEQVIAESPEFAPVFFNGGFIYRSVGETAKAVTALERYLELEPEGDFVSAAQSILAELQGTPSGETTPAP